MSVMFAPTRVRTVGVEEELLLVDAKTMQPIPVAGEVLRSSAIAKPHPGDPVLEFEAKHEQLEVVSAPRSTFDDLLATIVQGRLMADTAARAVGARAVALGTAPLPCSPHLVSAPRFQQMQQEFGITMDEQLTCGFHVHVAVDSDEEGVGVLDRIRAWLPVLLALSANSPYWHGIDTGYASFRYQAWSRWPSAGAYDVFGSAEAYHRQVDDILATGVTMDTAMVYFDARLSHHVPTVEIRIADVCLRPRDAAVLATLTRALVETAAAEWATGAPADTVPTSLLRLASWRASKSGLTDSLIHPRTRRPVPAATAVGALLAHVRTHFSSCDEERLVCDAIRVALRRGTGADLQRAAMTPLGSCADVIEAAAYETIRG